GEVTGESEPARCGRFAQRPSPGNALEWTRTTTGETPHKALNLARLPIPPRARAWAEYRGRVPCRSVRRGCTLVEHTFVLESALGARCAMVDLTKRQQEIFEFIKRYSARHGYPPTVRDIGKAVGLASSSTVHAHLANLEKVGLLRRDPTKPRAIELLDRAVDGMRSMVRPPGLPLLGQVAAGQPI